MSDKNNIKYYEKIIMFEDEIYDSDALDNYDAFILKCIKFAEKNIISNWAERFACQEA